MFFRETSLLGSSLQDRWPDFYGDAIAQELHLLSRFICKMMLNFQGRPRPANAKSIAPVPISL